MTTTILCIHVFGEKNGFSSWHNVDVLSFIVRLVMMKIMMIIIIMMNMEMKIKRERKMILKSYSHLPKARP